MTTCVYSNRSTENCIIQLQKQGVIGKETIYKASMPAMQKDFLSSLFHQGSMSSSKEIVYRGSGENNYALSNNCRNALGIIVCHYNYSNK